VFYPVELETLLNFLKLSKINIFMINNSKLHLKKSQETYWAHLFWAVTAGFKMIAVGMSSIIHGIVPGLFQGNAAKLVIDFYHQRLKNHPNSEYQQYIKNKL